MCNFETLSVGNPAHSDRVVKNWKLTRWNNKMMSCVWVRFRWKSGEKQKNVLITTGEKQLSHLPPGHKSLLHCLCQLVCHLVAMDCCSHTEEGFNGTFSCYFACLTFCQLVIIFVGSIKHCLQSEAVFNYCLRESYFYLNLRRIASLCSMSMY